MSKMYKAVSQKHSILQVSDDASYLKGAYSWCEDLEIEEIDSQVYWLSKLPEEFRGPISYMAYERGHHAGEEEVQLILESLVRDLSPAILAYTERLYRER